MQFMKITKGNMTKKSVWTRSTKLPLYRPMNEDNSLLEKYSKNKTTQETNPI